MSLLGDLEQNVLKSVLGGASQPADQKTTASTNKTSKKTSGVKNVLTQDVIGMAADKLKSYTPDSVDKIIDDVAESAAN